MRTRKEIQKLDLTKILPQQYTQKFVLTNENSIKSNVKNQFKNSVTVTRFLRIDEKFFYNLGLWCGDKYWFDNSVGLT